MKWYDVEVDIMFVNLVDLNSLKLIMAAQMELTLVFCHCKASDLIQARGHKSAAL